MASKVTPLESWNQFHFCIVWHSNHKAAVSCNVLCWWVFALLPACRAYHICTYLWDSNGTFSSQFFFGFFTGVRVAQMWVEVLVEHLCRLLAEVPPLAPDEQQEGQKKTSQNGQEITTRISSAEHANVSEWTTTWSNSQAGTWFLYFKKKKSTHAEAESCQPIWNFDYFQPAKVDTGTIHFMLKKEEDEANPVSSLPA